jgi:hypothetical protein
MKKDDELKKGLILMGGGMVCGVAGIIFNILFLAPNLGLLVALISGSIFLTLFFKKIW